MMEQKQPNVEKTVQHLLQKIAQLTFENAQLSALLEEEKESGDK